MTEATQTWPLRAARLEGPVGTGTVRTRRKVAAETSSTEFDTMLATHRCVPARIMATGRPLRCSDLVMCPLAGSKRTSRLR